MVRTLVYEVVYSCSFEFLRNFFRKFVKYEFSAAPFIKILSYQSFDVKCLQSSRDACVDRQARKWSKIGGVWFSLLIIKLIDC